MSAQRSQGLLRRSGLVFVGAAAVLMAGGAAMADHRRGRGCDDGWRGRGHSHWHGHGTRVGFSTGWGDCGSRSSFSISVGSGWRDCGPRYCPPPVVYRPAPVVVYDSCPPPVVVRSYPVYSRPVVVSEPVVVERPVVVEKQVVVERPVERVTERVVERPVVVEKQVIVERPVERVVEKVVEKPVYVEPAPEGTEPGRYEDRELGDAYLRMGDAENAARAYKRYLAAWSGDGTASRNYGFAQVARGEVQEGFRSVAQGYRLEPDLIKRQLRQSDLGGAAGFQRLLDAASRGASGTNTAEGWLTVAILQNAAGDRDSAVNALQRARDAGLDQTLLDRFTLQLSREGRTS